MDSHTPEIHPLNNALELRYYQIVVHSWGEPAKMLENSTHYVKNSMKPFASIPAS